MLFNSLEFALFLPIVFSIYWFLLRSSVKKQNILIVLASYIFYGWWDWRFLTLIAFSTLVDFFIGIRLSKETIVSKRKLLLWSSITINLGFLGVFKYYNFFIDNFMNMLSMAGIQTSFSSLRLILPIGISFYTFQTLSYSIDVYKKKLDPVKDVISFAAFVSFFPQLVAGPIERASNLLPQFLQKRDFEYAKAVDGLKQILWGLFKKIVIADNCAFYANMIFNNQTDYNGSTLFLGAVFFTFQIYGDFSGYSDIAIGTARLFGFSLMRNFAFPYFSRDIAEFWRSWHISLSTWFRDYLYIPLGGSRGSMYQKIRNTFVIFVVSGFWHGANWTFIMWGTLHALFFIPLLVAKRNRNNLLVVASHTAFPTLKEFVQMAVTFCIVVLSWIFFRSENVSQAFYILNGIFSSTIFSLPEILPIKVFFLLTLFVLLEWNGRRNEYGIASLGISWKKQYRWGFYYILLAMLFVFKGSSQQFIYFQF